MISPPIYAFSIYKAIQTPQIWEMGDWASDGTFYGAYNGRLYKNTDFLATRGTQIDNLVLLGITPVVKVTSAGTILWGYAPTIRRSADGGANFTTVLTATGASSWWRMVQSPDTGTIFVCTYGTGTKNLYRSVDDGENWTVSIDEDAPPLGLTYDHLHMVEVDPNGIVYVHMGDNFPNRHTIRSLDDGITWELMDETYHPASLLSFKDDSGNVVMLWGSDYQNPVHIYRSINNETTPTFSTVYTSATHSNYQNIFTMSYYGNGRIVASVSNDQFSVEWPFYVVSEDYGLTWTEMPSDQFSSAIYAGGTFSTEHNTYQGWALFAESGSPWWAYKTRSFLIKFGINSKICDSTVRNATLQ